MSCAIGVSRRNSFCSASLSARSTVFWTSFMKSCWRSDSSGRFELSCGAGANAHARRQTRTSERGTGSPPGRGPRRHAEVQAGPDLTSGPAAAHPAAALVEERALAGVEAAHPGVVDLPQEAVHLGIVALRALAPLLLRVRAPVRRERGEAVESVERTAVPEEAERGAAEVAEVRDAVAAEPALDQREELPDHEESGQHLRRHRHDPEDERPVGGLARDVEEQPEDAARRADQRARLVAADRRLRDDVRDRADQRRPEEEREEAAAPEPLLEFDAEEPE